MKLDEYVKQTLLDITNGVAEAQSESQLFIAPGRIDQDSVTSPQMVSFELPVYFQLQTERHPRGRVHFTEAEAEKSS